MKSIALAAMLVTVLVGCAGQPAPPSATQPAPTALVSADQEGPFHLELALPAATWPANRPITGRASLSLTVPGSRTIAGSGSGVIAFAYTKVGGGPDVQPAWRSDCSARDLIAGVPITSGLTKSGGFSNDQPDAAFYRAFLAGPDVVLPPGEWDVTAVATFIEGAGCDGASHTLTATVRIHVE